METKARKKDRKRDGREEEARLTLDPDIWPLGQRERTAEQGDYPPPTPPPLQPPGKNNANGLKGKLSKRGGGGKGGGEWQIGQGLYWLY